MSLSRFHPKLYAFLLPLIALLPLVCAEGASVAVTVSPASITLHTSNKKTFQSTVSNSSNKGVTWKVNGVIGGCAVTGTIDKYGNYTAPAKVPSPNTVSVQAVSKANTAKIGSSTVTLLNVVPTVSSLSVTEVNSKLPFTLTVNGSGFTASAQVAFSDRTALTVTSRSATQISVRGTTNSGAGAQVQVTVTNPNPGATVSNARALAVAAPVAVSVSPKAATLRGLTTTSFSASVSNTATKTVTWAVNGVTGGNATLGTISPSGVYSAPAVIPASVTVSAISTADPTKAASAQVTLQNPVPVISSATSPVTAGAATSVTINGMGFAPGAQVLLGNAPLAVSWVSTSKLIASGTIQPTAGGVLAAACIESESRRNAIEYSSSNRSE